MPPAMLDLFGTYGITILQGYGMTECAPVISTTVSWNVRKGSVGQLLPNCEAKVVDEEDLSPFLVDLCEGLLGYLDGLLDSPELMAYVDPEGEVALSREALSRAEGAITRAARRMAAPKGEELPRS